MREKQSYERMLRAAHIARSRCGLADFANLLFHRGIVVRGVTSQQLIKSDPLVRQVDSRKFQDNVVVLPVSVTLPCSIEDSPKGVISATGGQLTPSKLTKYYSMLSKFRLTGLVVWSAVAGYAMAPLATDPATLMFCLTGTALTSASANTINQFFEVPFDSQMARTSNRVLVRGLLRFAICFYL